MTFLTSQKIHMLYIKNLHLLVSAGGSGIHRPLTKEKEPGSEYRAKASPYIIQK